MYVLLRFDRAPTQSISIESQPVVDTAPFNPPPPTHSQMINIALTAGSLALGAPTTARGALNRQGSQAVDLSSTMPRRNSEDEASWASEHLSPDPSSMRTDSEAGSPTAAIVGCDALASASRGGGGGNSRKKGVLGAGGRASGEIAHVALNLNPAPAVKKLTKTAGAAGAGEVKPIELAWDFSLAVKATTREQNLTGKTSKPILTNVSGTVRSGQMMAVMGSSGALRWDGMAWDVMMGLGWSGGDNGSRWVDLILRILWVESASK